MKARFAAFLLSALFWGSPGIAQSEAPSVGFRRANEFASRSRWDDAIREYGELAKGGVASPSLYWNWSQAASASGRKGEALWALLRSRDLMPSDANVNRELDRLRGELGLDPSEVSLGIWGDARVMARRFRFDAVSVAALLVSILASLAKRRPPLPLVSFMVGLLFMAPFVTGMWREPRGVVVQKEAPLVDLPRTDAVALANLREGEVVPLLGEEGDYVRIQDASGARGFAHRADVLRIESN